MPNIGSGGGAGSAASVPSDPSDATQKVQRMSMKQRLIAKLTEAFQPIHLTVEDESHRHAGHAGARPGGETHFNVHMVASAFAGKTRVECHRMVHAVLADELRERVHALALRLEAG